MTNHSLFFYKLECPLCVEAMMQVASFFATKNKPILFRRITPEYYPIIQGLPAILVRKDVFNTQQEIVILGSRMIEQLKQLDTCKL